MSETEKPRKDWIRPQMLVKHVNGLIMTVDYLDVRIVDGKSKLFGVKCSYTDSKGNKKSDSFHSQELTKYERPGSN
jgi:hypothetical protein